MASTTVEFSAIEASLPTHTWLFAKESGLVAPSSLGYTVAPHQTEPGVFRITIAEACVGIYRLWVVDVDGNDLGEAFVWIKADDTNTYFAGPSLDAVMHRKENAATIADLADGGRLDAILDSVLADTNELQSDLKNGGRLDLLLDSVLADTDELQQDWVDGGRLDELLDAITTVVNSVDVKTTTGTITLSSQVSQDGVIGSIFRGADYLESHNEAFAWIVPEVPGLLVADAGCKFGGYREGFGEWFVTGTVADNNDGTWTMSFDLPGDATVNIKPGDRFNWTAGITASNEEQQLPRITGRTSIRDNFLEETRV